jgi:hypothetical protein
VIKKWAAKCGYSLCPTRYFYNFLYVLIFHLFSNIYKTVLESTHAVCREFCGASFAKTISSKDKKEK